MGEQTNAPERWVIEGSPHRHENTVPEGRLLEMGSQVRVVRADLYEQAIRERDRLREALERADEILSGGASVPADRCSSNALVDRFVVAREITSAALSVPSGGDGDA